MTDGITTTTAPPGDEDGGSTSSQLALAVGGLLGIAALLVLLTVVYFLKTRPGEAAPAAVAAGATDDSGVAPTPVQRPPEEPGDKSGPVAAKEVTNDKDPVGGIAALTRLLEDNPPGEVPAVETEGFPAPKADEGPTD